MAIHEKADVGEMLVFEQAHVKEGKYAGKSVSDFVAARSVFESCDFTRMKMARACFGSGFERSIYRECAFDYSEIRASAPGVARFERCTFLGTHFLELNCRNVSFVDCVFSGVIDKGYFSGSINVDGIGLSEVEFHGNDFSNAKLIDIDFRLGVDLARQKLPTGNQYFYINNARKFLDVLNELRPSTPLDVRGGIDVLRKMIERDLSKGQRQLFFSSDGFPNDFLAAFAFIRNIC